MNCITRRCTQAAVPLRAIAAGELVGYFPKVSHALEVKSMGVRPTQLTENRKSRLAKLLQILTAYHVFLWPKRREL